MVSLASSVRCAVLAVLAAGAAAQGNPKFDAVWQELTRDFHAALDAQGIVGGSVMFVADGKVLGQCFHGFADLATKRAVDERTIYHWASNTKTLTGIAIMQLRDRGMLSLDDPILEYVPELRAVHDPYGALEKITLRHLMSHSAGFRGPTWPWGGEEWHPHEPAKWSQLVAMMPYTKLEFEPGKRFSYSNPGIVFLGQVIERLTGDDWEVYIDKNILKPLRMHDSYFDVTPYHLLPHRSDNYTVVDGKPVANGLDFDTGITTSNGGWNAPLPDLVKYMTFLTGAGDEQADAVLKRSSLQEMWQPMHSAGEGGGVKSSMGLTFFVLEDGSRRYLGHTGGQKSFISFLYLHPESRTAAIAAFNTIGTPRPNTRGVLGEVRSWMFEKVFPLFDPQGAR